MKILSGVLSLALLASSFAVATTPGMAGVLKPQSCKLVAKYAADNKARQRLFRTAALGGVSAIVIGAIISNNNSTGIEKAHGLFGGGLIAGKGYKVQWQREYHKAYRACRAGH